MPSHKLITLQKLMLERKLAIEQDREIKAARLAELEEAIKNEARKYQLWKSTYKTVDDLYTKVKEAKRWQGEKFGLFMSLILQWRFGPKSRNDEIRAGLEKRNILKEEIEDLEARSALLEKEPPLIPTYFIDAGMAEQQKGYDQYVLTADARDVILWFFLNNEETDLTELYFQKHFITMNHERLNIETVKKYFREEKKMANYQKKHPELNPEEIKAVFGGLKNNQCYKN